ncbi:MULTISPECIES: biotin--[acetyl-CoA-carboxylase] ligase [unclassified Halomonas]|uniref:biotin--[acetyl-CoA-carboxylase] ligase n=1 Tax=unclassified Halomonas TaxID=2609666 RepID=UPI001C970B46|nr:MULTISPECIES: biotin--[acetyl-CoA-carboxylase] ligase [unclassified Halomonas]MBY5942650.1 biotin--[acetyl-CoA-carboxylase] ligase [Halomonas sp. DP5N14-9]MBY6112571.1 biotin--[acetyl-CoA-carboxylase] ligase [Halomonas sp. DP1Y21-3]MCJ8287865.1 biotin--[acetyl-CoA-carboxylase] ligase [Halomonas sp.]NQY72585.1 biotin--[acetyl-CoA-carboxylase] ligase [Halomonas sp.]
MTIGELIRLLSDGEFHSGQQLGEKLGVSRAAVWKQLRKLEDLGIPMEAVKGQGYRLAEPLELLDGPSVVAALSRESRRHLSRLFVEDTLPSSNEFLRERFRQGAGHAEACLVEQQSAGRGRRGRTWTTPWGRTLMCSVGWRFDSGVAALEGLSLAIGVVLAQVLERHGLKPGLKWPNDVLLPLGPQGSAQQGLDEQGATGQGAGQQGFGKLAGILVEMSGDAAGPCEVVLGMGINVDLPESFRAKIDQPVACVHDQAPGLSRNVLAAELLDGLLGMLAGFEEQGFDAWRDAWNARHAFAGWDIEIIRGEQRELAQAGDVDGSGNLWVRKGVDGERQERLVGGEISVRARP